MWKNGNENAAGVKSENQAGQGRPKNERADVEARAQVWFVISAVYNVAKCVVKLIRLQFNKYERYYGPGRRLLAYLL